MQVISFQVMGRRGWAGLGALLLGGWLLLSPAAGADLPALQSPGFDQAGPGGLPVGWTHTATFGTVKVALDHEVKRTGAGSLRVDLAAGSGCALSQRVALNSAEALSFGCWVRTRLQPPAGAWVRLQWYSAEGGVLGLSQPSARLEGEQDWTSLWVIGTPPEGAQTVEVRIIIGQGLGPGGSAWVDDTVLQTGIHPATVLRNPGFELNADGDSHPDFWRPFISGQGFTLSWDPTVARSGQASARLHGAPGAGDRSCYGQNCSPSTPAPGLRLRFWYKGTGNSTGFVRYRPVPGVKLNKEFYETFHFPVSLPRPDWSELVYEVQTPAAVMQEKLVVVEVTIYQRGEGTLWLDDLSLETFTP